MQGFPIDVEDQRGQRVSAERSLGRAAGPGQPFEPETAHALGPVRVDGVELGQRASGGAGVLESLQVNRRGTEMPASPLAEDAGDEMPEPPRDRGHWRRAWLWPAIFHQELAGPPGQCRVR